MAVTYGGLWAGATSLYASIACQHRLIDALHAGQSLGVHRLEADRRQLRRVLADTAPSDRTAVAGRAARPRRGPSPRPSVSSLSAAPRRSSAIAASRSARRRRAPARARPLMSNRRYLKLVLPRLATRIFMIRLTLTSCSALSGGEASLRYSRTPGEGSMPSPATPLPKSGKGADYPTQGEGSRYFPRTFPARPSPAVGSRAR